MSKIQFRMAIFGALALAAWGGAALSAQDRYTVKAPNGLAFSEFKGYETWQVIGVSQARTLIEVILGNPAMIEAYKSGSPGNGKPFPDGARMAKIHWNAKQSKDPGQATVPDTLHDIDFMMKDSKKFPDSGGWGYQQFNYDNASDTFTPSQDDAKCGVACHTVAKNRDYVFTEFPKR